MSWLGLTYKGAEPLFPEEYNRIIDGLDELYARITRTEDCIEERFKTRLLAYCIFKFAYANEDIFDEDILTEIDGIVRTKISANKDVYVLMKWIPNGTNTSIVFYLNDKTPIPANTWKELDFTVSKNDKVNVRIIPEANVVVFLFNIGISK